MAHSLYNIESQWERYNSIEWDQQQQQKQQQQQRRQWQWHRRQQRKHKKYRNKLNGTQSLIQRQKKKLKCQCNFYCNALCTQTHTQAPNKFEPTMQSFFLSTVAVAAVCIFNIYLSFVYVTQLNMLFSLQKKRTEKINYFATLAHMVCEIIVLSAISSHR